MNAREEVLTAYCQMYPELVYLAKSFTKGKECSSEDLVQDLCINLSMIPSDKVIENSKEFIKACLFNRCLNWNTTNKVKQKYANRWLKEPMLNNNQIDSIESIALDNSYERFDDVAEFSNLLGRKQRAVFLLILEGKSIKEIAEAQGSAYNTAKHNRRLIVEKLHTYFNEKGMEFNYERIKVSSAV